MRRPAVPLFIGLASASCALLNPSETVPQQPPIVTESNPLADSLAAVSTTPPTQEVATPVPESPTAVPTPVTTASSSTRSETLGAVTVVTISNVTRYALVGNTPEELDDYMRTQGPVDSTGFQWFALTEPSFDWQYTCDCEGGGCVTGPVKVFVILDYTLPTWDPPPGTDDRLVGWWTFFERALATHEQGHGDLASTCGQMLGEAFVAIGPQASCDAVDGVVAAASGPVFGECRAAQRAYEDDTAHGQRDGVLWPPQ